jgi:oligopeptidase A
LNSTENPFLNSGYYPAFDRMQPEHVVPALRTMLADASAAVDNLEKSAAPTWDGLMDPLYRACQPVTETWTFVSHMLGVMNNDGWRKAHDEMQPEIVTFSLRVGQSTAFHRAYLALREADRRTPQLTPARRRILDSAILGATLSGVALEGAKKERFNAIQQELATRGTAFSNNLLDAVKSYSLWIRDPADMCDLPAPFRAAAALAAREAGEPAATAEAGPWRITLDAASYVPFLKHSPVRRLREQLYRAGATKASSGPHDNTGHIESILALRREMAILLGFPHYAGLSLATKMASSVEVVDQLLADLAKAARDPGAREHDDLFAFARTRGFAESALAPWDMTFWSERLREARHDYNEEELRAYLPLPRVLEGMFALAERLFDIRIQPADGRAPVWHPDVRFFEVADADGTPLACFFLDPYSRPATKQGGAWHNAFRTRDRLPDGSLCLPMSALICNQTMPADGQPSLMRFDEVTTLFHEFGHALQHMLTTVEDPEASGLHNIEWDAVEIASQFMENWCYDHATLRQFAQHYQTHAPIPDEFITKIRAAKNHRAAYALLRQLLFAITDMDLHARYPRPEWPDADAVKHDVARRLPPMTFVPEDRFLCGFSHLFAGGYAAGYYSYKWSEVHSADAFAAFEEAGLDNDTAVRATGRRYRDTILALGGSVHPRDVYNAFRGRPPTITALLRHAGLT